MNQKQREQLEELADTIASDIASQEDDLMRGIYSRYEDDVKALVEAHGAKRVRDILEDTMVEYENPRPYSPAELMEELLLKRRSARAV